MGIWLLLLLQLTIVCGEYWLSTSSTHILFSGDVEILYEIPSSPDLQVQLFQGEKIIAKRDIPQNITKGKIIFPCGTFHAAGHFLFKLVSTFAQDKVLAETNYISVIWPEMTVHVPLMVETYSSNVIVQLYVGFLKCKSNMTFRVFSDLVYSDSGVDAWHSPTVLATKELFYWFWNASFDVVIDCEYFDRAGNYTIHIRSDIEGSPDIAVSDTIVVIWSHHYSVSVTQQYVQPCDSSLSVIYHYPRCILDQDRIRVYGRSWRGPEKYIRESKIIRGKHATKMSCDIFYDEYQEYCFSFVSIAHNGAVFHLKTHCIPTTNKNRGTWNEWSSWSECSSSCGVGVQSRFRLCISSKNGSDCVGKAVQSQSCELRMCTEEAERKEESFEKCSCGCERNATTEKSLLKFRVEKCEPDASLIIYAWPTGHVIVDVLSITFPTEDYCLIIRDGKSSLGLVLAVLTSPRSIPSLSNQVRIEVHTLSNITSIQNVEILLSIMKSETPKESLAMFQQSLKSINNVISNLSPVHYTIIFLTAIVFSTTAFLIMFRFCRQLRKNTSSYSAAEILTSTSDLSTKTPSIDPEDYMYKSFIFRSSPSLHPKIKWTDVVSTSSPVRRRGRPFTQRDSATPLTASLSELSATGSEDGLEYDYYDYGCHQEPGSFFYSDHLYMGWPPFIPLPPHGMEEFGDYPLQNFISSPEHP